MLSARAWALVVAAFSMLATASSASSAASITNENTPTTNKKPPVKVFLLAGQSNMQGHGYMLVQDDKGSYRNGTLEWMVATDPTKYGKLKDSNGNWTVRDDVWIAYNRQNIGNVRVEMNQFGPLTPGYGGDPGQQGQQMGPELGFGWTVADGLVEQQEQQQILLVKIAWGGRSLAGDYRPPSSGGDTGIYYQTMIANTYKTLAHLDQYFPDYDGRYELAGFAWHQGWNDGCDVNMTAEYEFNLANLIRDVRKDLDAPNLPVSIGVSGMDGWRHNPRRDGIIHAQFAVAKYPEFKGTVESVETRDFLRPPLPESPGKQSYHWNNNCETYWLIGKAMGEAMLGLLPKKKKSTVATSSSDKDNGALALKEEKDASRQNYIRKGASKQNIQSSMDRAKATQ
ncbi:Domain of unknown function (DUF303) [Seminavis robusta]|uniref:Sialate O-acetylesterase domain-containing protein n=1 Tax=Seminavis robusta TaxID=568900 RepID=A0A9N8HF02_9STRA|nr:Domain of unknown function (DUF303) [Seminavis robusta]|eukprot:Sro326_g118070.1 Domain of unknown function (DUF303) (397) ;mRNA; r:29112-30481